MERNFRERKKESGDMNICRYCIFVTEKNERYFCSSEKLKRAFIKAPREIEKETIEVDEAFGCRFFESKKLETCSWCDGSGYYSLLEQDYLCKKCHGTGKIEMLDLADYEKK